MPASPDSVPDLSRRMLLRRAAVAGLLATSAASLLAACAGSDTTDKTTTGNDNGNEDRNGKEVRMAGVLVLHHAQGLTEGIRAFADQLRQAGHTVHTPDVYDGKIFPTLDEGVAYAQQVGFAEIRNRGVRSADGLPAGLVYIGFSLGVMAAQQLAQTRAGARGAVLIEACVPPSEFGTPWPAGVPVQVHGMDADPFFAGEGDINAARALVNEADDAELFVYPGDRHLFTDNSLSTYDAGAAALVTTRVLDLLSNR
jgi:dienelactone hydrolase